MAQKKRRFITLELCSCMTDEDEHKFKMWIAQGLRELRFASPTAYLKIPREVLRTQFDSPSDIQVHEPQIIKP